MEDRKKYNSDDKYTNWGARLTKDAEVKEGATGKMVRVTFVSESKSESDSPLWIEATVRDYDAHIASYLKKGDTIGVEGKPTLSRYGDNNEKFSFRLRRAELHIPIPLLMALKDRGFSPQGTSTNGTNGKPATQTKATVKRPVVQLDDE